MAQGRCSAVLVVALLVVSAAMAVQGVDHIVGGDKGWVKPNGNTIADSYLFDWAKGVTFTEGDNLIFNYNTAAHNVMMVKEADYTSCITTAALQKWTTGKDIVKLGAGSSFFICGTPSHCDAGQKFTITAAASTTPANSAASGNAVTILQAFLAAVVALVATIALW